MDGGGGATLWRFEIKRRRAYRKQTADGSRQAHANGGMFFDRRSIFDPVIRGQTLNFREIGNFSTSMRISQKL